MFNLEFGNSSRELKFLEKVIADREDCLRLDISVSKKFNGYILKQEIENISNCDVNLFETVIKLGNLFFHENLQDDYFYSNENARMFGNLTIPIDYNRENLDDKVNKQFDLDIDTKWDDPEVVSNLINHSPYQPYPAVLFSNYNVNSGLVIGSLSQDSFYHYFDAKHVNGYISVNIHFAFKAIDYRTIKSGETLTSYLYIGEIDCANDINRLFDNYNIALRSFLKDNCGASSVNRRTLIWDSWNDGIYRNVSEDMLVQEAKAAKRYFSNLEWFQLDDGYSKQIESNVDAGAHGLGVYYEENHGIDEKKFPNGLKGYTEKIKEIGLKPAIWVGGFCPIVTQIYRENPDWFIDYSYRINSTQPLDVSKIEAREYMKKAISWFIKDCGFEGLKHDFWSYAFEDSHNLLENKDKSGYEHREWWMSYIRRCLGEGYIQTGCDVSMGNPFIGKYFNNYRFGLDVGAGDWERVVASFFWGVSVLSTHSGDLFVPNCDSLGILPNLNDSDFMFIVNFAIITRSLVEISGRFSKVESDNKRLKVLQRATKYLNNGEDVFFAKYDYRKNGINIPCVVYIKSAFDGCDNADIIRTVALFNSSEQNLKVSFSLGDLDSHFSECKLEDVWNNEILCGNSFDFELKPHESRLFYVKRI